MAEYELHVDADSTKVFASVYGEWSMFGYTRVIAVDQRTVSEAATNGGVRVLDRKR